jgi:hypothetical protein
MLMMRLLGVETQTTVWPPMGPRIGWYGMYSGWYAYPDVTTSQIAIRRNDALRREIAARRLERDLGDLNPTSVQKDAPTFADVILGALRKDGSAACGRAK